MTDKNAQIQALEALRLIATMPLAEQDNMIAANMRAVAIAVLSSAAPSAAEPVAVGYTWIESNGTRSFAAEKTVADALTKYGVREVHPVYLAAPPAPQAASEPVAGLSGDAEREALTDEQCSADHRRCVVRSAQRSLGFVPTRGDLHSR